MFHIRPAIKEDAADILCITKRAFTVYRDELHSNTSVKALSETVEDVLADIKKNNVYVAVDENKILGSIRFCHLTNDLAYIYRFGVDTDINNTGIGSDLLNEVINNCTEKGYKAIALHTNSRYYKLARYYYGKQFYVHSTTVDKGYIRALFIKELIPEYFDISPAHLK